MRPLPLCAAGSHCQRFGLVAQSNHRCPDCDRNIHGICGVPNPDRVGDRPGNSFTWSQLCLRCARKRGLDLPPRPKCCAAPPSATIHSPLSNGLSKKKNGQSGKSSPSRNKQSPSCSLQSLSDKLTNGKKKRGGKEKSTSLMTEQDDVMREGNGSIDDPSRAENDSLLVAAKDNMLLSTYMCYQLQQLRFCRCEENDRQTQGSWCRDVNIGFGGVECRHCARRFFPTDLNRLKVLFSSAITNHLQQCCPVDIRRRLRKLKKSKDAKDESLPLNWRDNFLQKLWEKIQFQDADDKCLHGSSSANFIITKQRSMSSLILRGPWQTVLERDETPFSIDSKTDPVVTAASFNMTAQGTISPSQNSNDSKIKPLPEIQVYCSKYKLRSSKKLLRSVTKNKMSGVEMHTFSTEKTVKCSGSRKRRGIKERDKIHYENGGINVRSFSSVDEIPAAVMAQEQPNFQHEFNGVEVTEPELNQTVEPSTKNITEFSEENGAENVEQKSSNMSNLGLMSNISRDNQIKIRRKRKPTLTCEEGEITATITSIIQSAPKTKRIRVLLSASPNAADKQYACDETPFEIQLPDHIPWDQKKFKVILPRTSLIDSDGEIICVKSLSLHDELPAAAKAKEQLNSQLLVAHSFVEITGPDLNQTALPSARRLAEFGEGNGAETMEQKSSNMQPAPPKCKRFRVSVLPDATDKQYAHERIFEVQLPGHIQRHQKAFKIVLPGSSLIDTGHIPNPTHEIQLP